MLKVTKIGYDNILSEELLKDKRLNTDSIKNVLAQAILYAGLNNNDYCVFYRTNFNFAVDAGVLNKDKSTTTFRFLIKKLINFGLIEIVKEGKRGSATVYKLREDLAKLNPFFEDKKNPLPSDNRIQITEQQITDIQIKDVDNSINKNYQQIIDNRLQKKENREKIKESVLTGCNDDVDSLNYQKNSTTTSTDRYKEELFKSCIEANANDNYKFKKGMEEFAKRGQEWWNWLCEALCGLNTEAFKAIDFIRSNLEKKYNLESCLPYKQNDQALFVGLGHQSIV